jgi:hypothetical protein
MFRDNGSSSAETSSAEIFRSSSAINPLFNEVLDEYPAWFFEKCLMDYESNAEGFRDQIDNILEVEDESISNHEAGILRGRIRQFLNALYQSESYASYCQFMEEQGLKPVEKDRFLRIERRSPFRSNNGYSRNRRRRKQDRGDYSETTIYERWEYIQQNEIRIGSSVMPRRLRQRSYVVAGINHCGNLIFKGDDISQKGHIPHYYKLVTV